MVLELVTYLCMMGVFGGFVLLHEGDEFDWSEIIFAIYILVSAFFFVVCVFRVLQRACACRFGFV